MPLYILLLTLTTKGRHRMMDDPDTISSAQRDTTTPDVETLGLYGVLGEYDFVSIIQAPDNDSAARFSLELGVKAGTRTTTLPRSRSGGSGWPRPEGLPPRRPGPPFRFPIYSARR